MTTWTTIGSKTPIAGAWTTYPVLTDCELFRLTHTWISQDWWYPRGLIAQAWDGAVLTRPFKIYPKNGKVELINLPIPLDYKFSSDPTLTMRAIAVMLLTPYKGNPVSYTWTLNIEGFPPNAVPQATGGLDWDEIYSATGDEWDNFY